MQSLRYRVENISCGHCVHTIQMELSALEGVTRVIASQETKTVEVEFGPPATDQSIRVALAEINYPVAE